MMRLKSNQVEDFAQWMSECGAEILDPKEGEILRVVVRGITYSAHWLGSSVQHWPLPLQEIYARYLRGMKAKLSKPSSQLNPTKRRSRVQALGKRDGWFCWYCGCALMASGGESQGLAPTTIEEICPRQIGGPAHIGNQVLACLQCNQLAKNLPVVEKVKLRESLRPAYRSQEKSQPEAQKPAAIQIVQLASDGFDLRPHAGDDKSTDAANAKESK